MLCMLGQITITQKLLCFYCFERKCLDINTHCAIYTFNICTVQHTTLHGIAINAPNFGFFEDVISQDGPLSAARLISDLVNIILGIAISILIITLVKLILIIDQLLKVLLSAQCPILSIVLSLSSSSPSTQPHFFRCLFSFSSSISFSIWIHFSSTLPSSSTSTSSSCSPTCRAVEAVSQLHLPPAYRRPSPLWTEYT